MKYNLITGNTVKYYVGTYNIFHYIDLSLGSLIISFLYFKNIFLFSLFK